MGKNILYLGNKCTIDGGASRIFNQLYNENLKNNKNIYLATSDLNVLEKNSENILCLEDSSENIFKILFNYKNYKLLISFIKKNKIEIVYMHNIIINLSPSVLLALKKCNIKVVYTLHQFDYMCPNSSLCNMNNGLICEKCVGKKIKWNILKEKCSYKGIIYDIAKFLISLEKNFFNIDKIINYYIVPSIFLKSKMIQEGINGKKIKVIKNFVNNDFWVEKNNIKEKNNIVYFGRFSKEKNVNILIDAIKLLKNKYPNICLFLIGAGEEYSNYIKKITEYNLEKNVFIINKFLASIELKKLLEDIKISVLPSKCYETFGLTIIESIFSNVIPIATNIGALKETIEDSFGFTFENNNSKDLANKIEYIFENYNLEFKNLLNKKEKIKNYYSIERYLKELDDEKSR